VVGGHRGAPPGLGHRRAQSLAEDNSRLQELFGVGKFRAFLLPREVQTDVLGNLLLQSISDTSPLRRTGPYWSPGTKTAACGADASSRFSSWGLEHPVVGRAQHRARPLHVIGHAHTRTGGCILRQQRICPAANPSQRQMPNSMRSCPNPRPPSHCVVPKTEWIVNGKLRCRIGGIVKHSSPVAASAKFSLNPNMSLHSELERMRPHSC